MTKTHYQYLDSRWFKAIKEGRKIAEGRLKKIDKKSWISELKVDDIIIFKEVGSEETITVRIIKLVTYSSFVEMFDKVGLANILPGILNNKEGVEVYRQWYSEDDEIKLGVIGIFIELC
jgi:ASC-1-like (ASCH) protein